MTAAWDLFVASIDPVKLERERTGHPRWSERPGSPADKQMRLMHSAQVERFKRRRLPRASSVQIVELVIAEREFDAAEAVVVERGGFTAAQWAVASAWADRRAS